MRILAISFVLLALTSCQKPIPQPNPNKKVEFSIYVGCGDNSRMHVTYSDSNFVSQTDTSTQNNRITGSANNFFVYSGNYKSGLVTATAWANDTSTIDIRFSIITSKGGQEVAEIQGHGTQTLQYSIPWQY